MRRSQPLLRALLRRSSPVLTVGSSPAALLANNGRFNASSTPFTSSTTKINTPSFTRGFASEADPDVFYPQQQAFVGHQAPRFTAPGKKWINMEKKELASFFLFFFPLSSDRSTSSPPLFSFPLKKQKTKTAFTNGDISTVSLDDYLTKNKYVVLAFYPKDFTYVCPTEIIAFSDRAKEFADEGAQVLVASTDTEEVHGAWTRVARSAGGLGKIEIPMIADTKKAISAAYGCERRREEVLLF